ncbi:MAG: LptF/LptG family permease [Saprospiraceae bacterium]|nr:LptF/LptG family permease [Saprospiraceae bacterium]MBK8485711.1 LptF/LptG family permease [Saprospiraceae bacterium]MBK9222938.1 LptF/LptG family permease [Saprospiraceae bacterium]MBK9720020.1 LptF/LptG family permease [Saprospiraceae bacterium]
MKDYLRIKILDRYIIGKYVRTFFFIMFLFSLISVVFDLSERIDKFISKGLSFWEVFSMYYINFLPWINSLLFPLYALITVIFFTSRMAGQTEIIPIFSSGVSFKRILKPFLMAGLLFTALHLVGNHIFVPKSNKILRDFDNKYIRPGNIKARDRNVHLFVAPNVGAYLRYYQSSDSSGIDFQMEKFEGEKIVQILRARTVKWKQEPNIWTLKDIEIRSFSDSTESILIQNGEQLDTAINMNPKDFVFISNQKDMMTTTELSYFIDREREKGSGLSKLYEVERQRRTADPFTTLILTFIGACIASRKVRGGMGLHLAAGVILGVIYIFLSKMSLTFANNDLMPPVFAIWLPNLVFLVIGGYFLGKAQQ